MKMNKAEQAQHALNTNRMNWTELLIEAGEIAEAIDQDYENETTTFKYADGSTAIFDGLGQNIVGLEFDKR
jgi:hypothetical protein